MTPTVVARVDRDVVVVSGPDATTFLQSLLSQDLDPVAVGDGTHALLLEPQGKLVVDLRAAARRGRRVVVRVRRRVRPGARAGPEAVPDPREGRDRRSLGGRRRARAARAGCARRTGTGVRRRAARSCRCAVDWPDAPGVELLGHPPAIDGGRGRLADAGAVEIDAAAYEALRVEAGVPRQGYDIDETTIAQEAFLERDAVSFTKGCFLGQELVCRIDSRGHVNRLLRRLRADCAARAWCRGRGRRQRGRDRHDRGRHRRAGDDPADSRAGRRRAGAHGRRRRHRTRRGGRRLSPGHATRRFRRDDVGRTRGAAGATRRTGCRLRAARRRGASPPIAAASWRTMARPRPVPTDRPGCRARGVEAVEDVWRGRRREFPDRRR